MYNRQYTPNWIDTLQPNEVFVFGSNLEGNLLRTFNGAKEAAYWVLDQGLTNS